MRTVRLLLVAVLTALSFPSIGAAAGPGMTPGKWQVTYHTVSPVDVPPMVSIICVDPPAAARVGPPQVPKNADCQVVTPAFDGTDLSYAMTCGKSGVRSQMKIKYKGNSFNGDLTVTNGDFVVTQHIEGVRLGACDEE
jgi:hypothetical protein